ncbi:MAG: hypothetical protein AAF413_00420 [Patescibacteria group bacterium]
MFDITLHILAHAGEEHSGAISSVSHYFGEPLNALLLWIGVVVAVHAVCSYALKLRRAHELLMIALAHFVLGVFFYEYLPNMGAIIISIGFALTLFLVIAGLGKPHSKE